MTYADAYAQAEREWKTRHISQRIDDADADDDGLSGFWDWYLKQPMWCQRESVTSNLAFYLYEHPRTKSWLDRRALAIQEQAAGHDDHDAAHDYAKENP